jgi:hypothetical protein
MRTELRSSAGRRRRTLLASAFAAAMAPTTVLAQETENDVSPEPAKVDVGGTDRPWHDSMPLSIRASVLGATDSNVLDDSKDPLAAAGADVGMGLQLAKPFGADFSIIGALTVNLGYREGLGTAAGKSALKIALSATTGIEVPILGRPPIRGLAGGELLLPALRLGFELRQDFAANPVVEQLEASVPDEAQNTLDPNQSADTAAVPNLQESGEQFVGVGTFTNPNTHYKPTVNTYLTFDVATGLSLTANVGLARDLFPAVDSAESRQYSELLSAVIGRYRLLRKNLRLSAGPTFERRWYDEQTFRDGTPRRFNTFGAKMEATISSPGVRIRLAYDPRYEVNDGAGAPDRVSHRFTTRFMIPITRFLSTVTEVRYSDTVRIQEGALNSIRIVALGGFEIHEGSFASE